MLFNAQQTTIRDYQSASFLHRMTLNEFVIIFHPMNENWKRGEQRAAYREGYYFSRVREYRMEIVHTEYKTIDYVTGTFCFGCP